MTPCTCGRVKACPHVFTWCTHWSTDVDRRAVGDGRELEGELQTMAGHGLAVPGYRACCANPVCWHAVVWHGHHGKKPCEVAGCPCVKLVRVIDVRETSPR